MVHVSALGRLGGLLDGAELEFDASLAGGTPPASDESAPADPVAFTPSSKVLDNMSISGDTGNKSVVSNQSTLQVVDQIFDGTGGLIDVFGRVINGSEVNQGVPVVAPSTGPSGAKIALVGVGVAALLGIGYVVLSR